MRKRGPHGTNNRSIIPETPAQRARRTGTIPQALAEVMIERYASAGFCTDEDLRFAGFKGAEIDEHAPAARELATLASEKVAA